MDWQPIETAPKDGTYILLWSERDGVGIGCWAEIKYKQWEETEDGQAQRLVGVNDYSRFCGMASGGIDMRRPTFWMPLPQSPTP